MYKKYIVLLISVLSLNIFAFAESNNADEMKIFQQYKQDTIFPHEYNNNYSLNGYNMFFGSNKRFGYDGYRHNNYRHNRHYFSGYRNIPPMFYAPFFMMDNEYNNDEASYYLRNKPKDTLVDPNEYNIFNKTSEK